MSNVSQDHEASPAGESTTEWVAADSGRQLLVLLGAMLLCLWSLRFMYGLGDRLRQIRLIARHDPLVAGDEILKLTDSFLLTMSAVLLLMAVYLLIQGLRLNRAGQFPVPGAKVVMKTRVARGRSLRRRVWSGWLLAALLAGAGLLLPSHGKKLMLRYVYIPVPTDAEPMKVFDLDDLANPLEPTAPTSPSGAN